MKKIHLICAARPNFMKIAPLYHALKREEWCEPIIVHTGQHYDYQMSEAFFEEFSLPKPHYHLGVGSGTHAEQTAKTMTAYENLCLNESKPDLVMVVGDVNATLSCTIAAKKLHLKVAHLEAGLRSYDRLMPEEINRVVTDSICDIYLTPSKDADQNLLNEGVDPKKIHFVGNIMIDTYEMMREKISQKKEYLALGLKEKEYGILTLHRPTNVDSKETLSNILETVSKVDIPFVFPVHPRTKSNLSEVPDNIKLVEPQSYVSFMSLVSNAKYVVSDSGGIQEETTYLQIPCFTLRNTTERPITTQQGSNQLVSVENILEKIKTPKKGNIPELWDGKTFERVVRQVKKVF